MRRSFLWRATLAGTIAPLAMAVEAQSDVVATVKNTAQRPMWLTVYVQGPMPGMRKIVTATCVEPDAETTVKAGAAAAPFRLRGEATRGEKCQQPVECDTSTQVEISKRPPQGGARAPRYEFRADPRSCWFQPISP